MADVMPNAGVPALPELNIVRQVSANDAALPTAKNKGINCSDFDEITVTATLLGGATAAAIELFYWSDAKNGTPNGGFVPGATAETLAVTASGQRKIFRVAHSIVWFNVTAITGGTGARVRIEVGGIPIYGRRGN